MRWTEDQTLIFVRELTKYECLCNINCDDYKNKQKREAALLQISKTMDLPDFGTKEVYLKIRSLKSTYSQELKKIKNSQRSGAGTSDVYKPNIKWFSILYDALQAMSSTGECRETTSSLEPSSPPDVQLENNEQDDETRSAISTSDSQVSATNSQTEKKESPLHKSINLKKNPRKRIIQNYDNLLTKVQNVANTINAPDIQSEFDIFGKSIAVQLKNMPLDMALEAQMFMQNYLSELRLRTLRRSSLSYYTISQPSLSPTSSSHSNNTVSVPSPSPSPSSHSSNIIQQPSSSPQTLISLTSAPTPPTPSTGTLYPSEMLTESTERMDLLSQAWFATNNYQ